MVRKMAVTQVNLDPDLKRLAVRFAKSKGMSYSSYVRGLIIADLDSRNDPTNVTINQHFSNAHQADIVSGVLEQ